VGCQRNFPELSDGKKNGHVLDVPKHPTDAHIWPDTNANHLSSRGKLAGHVDVACGGGAGHDTSSKNNGGVGGCERTVL